jgi:predicted nucleic acid-binding protein
MGLSALLSRLEPVSRIGLDTSPIIYFVEANPQYANLANAVFQEISQGNAQGFTSTISLTEVLVFPLHKKLTELEQKYIQLLSHSQNLTLIPINVKVAETAAALRAKYKDNNLRTPDALQIAAAIEANCQVFVTNDKRLHIVQEIEIIVLEDFLV